MNIKSKISKTYNEIVRPRLPITGSSKYVKDIEVVSDRYQSHLFDKLTPVPTPHERYLKERNIEMINKHVSGDLGVSIGSGYGVTSVALSKKVDHIIMYEGSTQLGQEIVKQMQANGIECWEVRKSIVGDPISIDGHKTSDKCHPSDLPKMDVLEMDCEGSEISILEELTQVPNWVVVETHPNLGADTDIVVSLLEGIGHTIVESVPDPVDGDIVVSKR